MAPKQQAVNEHGLTEWLAAAAKFQGRMGRVWRYPPARVMEDMADAFRTRPYIVWRWQADPAFQARVEALGGRVHQRPADYREPDRLAAGRNGKAAAARPGPLRGPLSRPCGPAPARRPGDGRAELNGPYRRENLGASV